MKKKRIVHLLPKRRLLKTWLIMRFIVLFMCVSAMQLTAAVYSQEVKVTLSVKDASFESVIRLLEANTEYTFLYEDRHIAEIGGLNLNFRDTDIKIVLDKCLQGTNLSYRLMNNHTIVIQRGVAVDTTKQKAPQKMSVSGVVKDVKGEVLPGVTIRIKNTQLGFVTDIDGKFKFDFPKGYGGFNFLLCGLQDSGISGEK